MQLTDQQIQELFRFCEKKYVRFYDLQVELVDHLAERIEENIKSHPDTSFETALQKVYKEFGVFGFAHIVRDKEKALRKQTNNAWLVELKRFFTLPKLAFTAALAAALYTVGTLMNADLRLWLIVSLWIIGTICQATKLVQFRKQKRRQLMLTQHHPIAVFAPVVLFFDNLIFLPQTFNSPLGFAIWGVFAVLMQATMFTVTKNIFSKARELYPEAFQMQRLSNN